MWFFFFERTFCTLMLPRCFFRWRVYEPVRHLCTLPSPPHGKRRSRRVPSVRGLDTDVWEDGRDPLQTSFTEVLFSSFTSSFTQTDHVTRVGNDLDCVTETRIQAKCKTTTTIYKVAHAGPDPHHIYTAKIHDVEETLSRRLKLPAEP